MSKTIVALALSIVLPIPAMAQMFSSPKEYFAQRTKCELRRLGPPPDSSYKALDNWLHKFFEIEYSKYMIKETRKIDWHTIGWEDNNAAAGLAFIPYGSMVERAYEKFDHDYMLTKTFQEIIKEIRKGCPEILTGQQKYSNDKVHYIKGSYICPTNSVYAQILVIQKASQVDGGNVLVVSSHDTQISAHVMDKLSSDILETYTYKTFFDQSRDYECPAF